MGAREREFERGEEEVVMLEVEAGDGERKRRRIECDDGGGGEEVRQEGWLPKMPVRVLLVESDDSTRQIIAALLRKCSYRVDSASDGLKAWEILKEKHHSIDLVLTEVDLPSVSGFLLLTMITEHDACKNIPVIMMSSHDSMSIVFKCMLRGAADFLVKPIRKNELSNLWQHVWRRQLSSGKYVGSHSPREEILMEEKLEANFVNDGSNNSGDCVAYEQKNQENTEKGSDAQSSCTKSEMEAESKCISSSLEVKESNCQASCLVGGEITQSGEEHDKMDSALLKHDDGEDMSILLVSESSPCKEACNSNKFILKDAAGGALATASRGFMCSMDCNHLTSEIGNRKYDVVKSQEAIDLIGAFDSFPRGSIVRTNAYEKDAKYQSSSIPYLELSLRRDHDDVCDGQENYGCRTVHHSNSSAFSLYNSRTKLPNLLGEANNESEKKESFSIATDPILDSGGSCNQTSAPSCAGVPSSINVGSGKSNETGITISDGMGVQCSPIRVIPFPAPVMWKGGGSSVVPLLYSQPGTSLWSAAPSTKSSQQHSLHQPELENPVSGLSTESLADNHQDLKQGENYELMHELGHASSATGGHGSRSICTSSRSHLNSSRCRSKINGNMNEPNTCNSVTDGGNEDGQSMYEGRKPGDTNHLSQRAAALKKFRLKKKDRCYGKKVRYQSRKRLAELRPRVKGQFVRQGQPYSSDAAVE